MYSFWAAATKKTRQLHFGWSSKAHQPNAHPWGRYNTCPYVTCGQMLLQAQNHCHSSWIFSTSENQATYFAAQPRLLKPNIVTHLFILHSSAWSEWSSTWGFYTKMCKQIQKHYFNLLRNHFLLKGRFLHQSMLSVVWWISYSHTESQWLEEIEKISLGRDGLSKSQTWGNSLALASLISKEIRL